MKQTICQKVSEGKPPVSNTGAENTVGLKALIDWCSFTFPSDDVGSVQALLGIPADDWVQMPKGGRYYKCQLRCGNISIFYDGMSPGMGINVNMSGQGCRQYENRFGNIWPDLFKRIFEAQGHFTRLDGAIDDFHGFFTLGQIEMKVEECEVVTRFKGARVLTKYGLRRKGEGNGKTTYFGSPSSDIQIRIYDKAAQQGADHIWVRTEIQCLDERADALARQIMTDNNLGQLLAGVLRNYIAFVDASGDSNKARWPVSSWWSEFLGCVDKVRLTIQKAVKTVQEKMEWVDRQVSTTMALIGLYLKGKGDDVYGFVSDMLISGEKRLKPHHEALLLAG